MLARWHFFHLAQFKQVFLQVITWQKKQGFLIQILTTEARTRCSPFIFSQKKRNKRYHKWIYCVESYWSQARMDLIAQLRIEQLILSQRGTLPELRAEHSSVKSHIQCLIIWSSNLNGPQPLEIPSHSSLLLPP